MDEQDESLAARATARLGSTLAGKYRLDRVLGIGGMATVFAATHRNQAELAVKLLHPELSLRKDLRKRFLREGYVGNSVKHPGAVLVVDDDVDEDGSAFLVMELLRGRSLEQLWRRGGRALGSRVVTALALQLLDVLAAAHEKAIVHRDLKPANLFLTLDGSLKVLDFGIARLRDAVGTSEHATRTGQLMGTPAFMAPEQAQAVVEEIDGQSDLWAVGATMYTLLSGKLVHEGDTSAQLLIRAGTARAGKLAAVAPKVEPPIAEVVDRALVFEKSARWPSAGAMRDALSAAATAAFGAVPSRDELTSLAAEATADREEGPVAPGAAPRVVVNGRSAVGGDDPTFPTPGHGAGASNPAIRGPSTPPPGATPIPAVSALSTGDAVSAEAPSPPERGRRLPWSSIAVATAVAVAGAAGLYAALRPAPQGAPAEGQTEATPLPAAAPAPSTAPPPVVSSAPASEPPPPAAAPSGPASVSASAVAVAAKPPPTTKPKGAPPASPRAAGAPSANAPRDCVVPYTLDVHGEKQWKPECLK